MNQRYRDNTTSKKTSKPKDKKMIIKKMTSCLSLEESSLPKEEMSSLKENSTESASIIEEKPELNQHK